MRHRLQRGACSAGRAARGEAGEHDSELLSDVCAAVHCHTRAWHAGAAGAGCRLSHTVKRALGRFSRVRWRVEAR